MPGIFTLLRLAGATLASVREDATKARRELAQRALEESPGRSPAEALERFLHTRDAAARRLSSFLRALSREGEPGLAGLTLAVRQLRTIVD